MKKQKRLRFIFYVFNTESSTIMTKKHKNCSRMGKYYLWHLNQGHCDPQAFKTLLAGFTKWTIWLITLDLCVNWFLLDSCAVFLLGVRGHSCPCGPADLPAAAQRNSQADLHLQLPQLCRLAAQRPPELRACTALQRRQRGGADAREHALHQRAVRRVSGRRRAIDCKCKPVIRSADQPDGLCSPP